MMLLSEFRAMQAGLYFSSRLLFFFCSGLTSNGMASSISTVSEGAHCITEIITTTTTNNNNNNNNKMVCDSNSILSKLHREPDERKRNPNFTLIVVSENAQISMELRKMFLENEDITPDEVECQCEFNEKIPNVHIVNGKVEDINDVDALLLHGNGFALMDGSADIKLLQHIQDYELPARIQEKVIHEYDGEMPVGTAFITEINSVRTSIKYAVFSPCMRVPQNIYGSDNVYKCLRAGLIAVHRFNKAVPTERKIKRLCCTPIGITVGQMPLVESARQMHVAWLAFTQPAIRVSWRYANKRQNQIRFGGLDGLMSANRQQKPQQHPAQNGSSSEYCANSYERLTSNTNAQCANENAASCTSSNDEMQGNSFRSGIRSMSLRRHSRGDLTTYQERPPG